MRFYKFVNSNPAASDSKFAEKLRTRRVARNLKKILKFLGFEYQCVLISSTWVLVSSTTDMSSFFRPGIIRIPVFNFPDSYFYSKHQRLFFPILILVSML